MMPFELRMLIFVILPSLTVVYFTQERNFSILHKENS
jgi:hypothetical protein